MPNEKPLPQMVNGRYRYTLTSYGPVQVTVPVPRVTEQDVELSAMAACWQAGLPQGQQPTDEWVADHVDGASSVAGLRDFVRGQLERTASAYLDAAKPARCAEQLAGRLIERVPEEEVERIRQELHQTFEDHTGEYGIDLGDALSGMGMPRDAYEGMLSAQARSMAEQQAALEAFADQRGIEIDDTELPGVMGLSPKEAREMLSDARNSGRLESLRREARQRKASMVAAAECSCTFAHESADAAAQRAQAMMAQRAMWKMPGAMETDEEGHEEPRPDAGGTGEQGPEDDGPRFKLV